MTQQQQESIMKTFTTYVVASNAATQAYAESAAAGAAMDKAKEFARAGVKTEMAALQAKADAQDLEAYTTFQAVFQKASDATVAKDAAYQAFQHANADSLNTPVVGLP